MFAIVQIMCLRIHTHKVRQKSICSCSLRVEWHLMQLYQFSYDKKEEINWTKKVGILFNL